MTEKQIIIGDKMIEDRLKENSNKLNISIEELIDRYIRRGLYSDDYYKQQKLSKEKLKEIFKIDEEPGNGNSPKNHHFDELVGIYKDINE